MLGKIPRLCGADFVVFPFALGGKAPYLHGAVPPGRRVLTYPAGDLKPTMPMPSGGITPLIVPDIVADWEGHHDRLGRRHPRPPQGPVAGARAFRQAIDATMKGIPLEEYAKDHEELDVAMGIWTGAFQETKA